MKGSFRKFAEDEIKTAVKERRFEELVSWGLGGEGVEYAAENVCLAYSAILTTYVSSRQSSRQNKM